MDIVLSKVESLYAKWIERFRPQFMDVTPLCLRILQAIMLFFALAVPIITYWRLSGHIWVGQIWKIFTPAIFLICCAGVGLNLRHIKFDRFIFYMGFLALYGGIVGLLSVHVFSAEVYGLRQVISHVFVILNWGVLYALFVNAELPWDRLESLLKWCAYGTVTVTALALAAYYTFNEQGYLGFAAAPLLFAVAFGLINRNYALLFIAVALMALTGKRSVFLVVMGMIFVDAYFINFQIKKDFLKRSAQFLVVGLLSVATYYAATKMSPRSEALTNKWSTLSKVQASMEEETVSEDALYRILQVASSGRYEELRSAINMMNDHNAWWTGMGYGFGFEFIPPTRTYVLWNHYVHFTPMNFVMQYGVFFGIAFMVWIGYALMKVSFAYSQGMTQVQRSYLLLAWGCVGVNLFSYSVSVNPLTWTLVAIVFAMNRQFGAEAEKASE